MIVYSCLSLAGSSSCPVRPLPALLPCCRLHFCSMDCIFKSIGLFFSLRVLGPVLPLPSLLPFCKIHYCSIGQIYRSFGLVSSDRGLGSYASGTLSPSFCWLPILLQSRARTHRSFGLVLSDRGLGSLTFEV